MCIKLTIDLSTTCYSRINLNCIISLDIKARLTCTEDLLTFTQFCCVFAFLVPLYCIFQEIQEHIFHEAMRMLYMADSAPQCLFPQLFVLRTIKGTCFSRRPYWCNVMMLNIRICLKIVLRTIFVFWGFFKLWANTSMNGLFSQRAVIFGVYWWTPLFHKVLRKMKVPICNHQSDSPLHVWPGVWSGDLPVERVWCHIWCQMSLLRPKRHHSGSLSWLQSSLSHSCIIGDTLLNTVILILMHQVLQTV